MKTVRLLSIGLMVITCLGAVSCKKCAECHYDDTSGSQVELGEFCEEELENLETNGYHHHDEDTTYEAHCHEH